MARRGIIPWDGEGAGVVSFRQAFLEGPWRNKWEPYFRSLADYIPPPRTVTAMVREGAMTDADALKWYRAAGLTQEALSLRANVDRSYVSQLERNLKSPTLDTLFLLCEALGVSAAQIVARVEAERAGRANDP